MKKVLAIIPDNNKGKFITKGFTESFRKLRYFVFEKKIYDLNVEEVKKIEPDIVFAFWTDKQNRDIISKFLNKITSETQSIHCAESKEHIPAEFFKKKSHHVFFTDSKSKKHEYIQPISMKNYDTEFMGYKYNITFAGNPSYTDREVILSDIIKNFGVINIFGRSFDFYKSLDDIVKLKLLNTEDIELYRKSYRGNVDTTRELGFIYSASKINLDIQSKIQNKINYRVLEVTAAGGFIITPYNKFLLNIYSDGHDIETYNNKRELIDKIRFYLKNTNISDIIALRGKERIAKYVSYDKELERILKVIYGKNISGR